MKIRTALHDNLCFVKFCNRYVDCTIKSLLSLKSLESDFNFFFFKAIYFRLRVLCKIKNAIILLSVNLYYKAIQDNSFIALDSHPVSFTQNQPRDTDPVRAFHCRIHKTLNG